VSFKSTHNLQFEVAPYEMNIDPKKVWARFRIGTVEGLWSYSDDAYEVLAVDNKVPNNGHLTDVIEWFENSCKRDKKDFKILEFFNERFKEHLIKKWGFEISGKSDLIKRFK